MSPSDPHDPDDASATSQQLGDDDNLGEAEDLDKAEAAEEEAPEKLNLDVRIETRSACERHVAVTIPREDIDRYFDKEFSELMPTAQVPGFRPGRAPRKLIEARFRKDISEKVKTSLLVDSLAQVNEDHHLVAISEPEVDLPAIKLPDDGPFCFEFDLEVRPEFELPKWKGLPIEKPVREFTDEDVDRALQDLLTNRGRLVPYDAPAEPGDYITANLTFRHGEQVLSSAAEEVIRIRPVLSFRDGKLENFDKLLAGVTAGETRRGEAELSQDAPNEALRGQKVSATFEVLEVKKLQLPELNAELLDELGGFELEADLRDAIRDTLQRRLEYQQRQRAREQITAALTVAADWELPPGLLQRQSRRELQRALLELQRSGFSDEEIRAHENQLRQNSRIATAQALKEHFILERIAEDQEIDAEEADYDEEIRLIAAQGGESPRRVRARLEKAAAMDVLRNQIVERKVIDLILQHAEFHEVPYEPERVEAEAINQSAGGGDQSDIPEAKPGGAEAAPSGRPAEPHARL
jgi:trigger factor